MAVGVVDDVVEVGDVLLVDEVAEDIDVAIRHGIGGEDVVIRDDDHLVAVPDFSVLAELALEDADGAGAADIVSHEDVHIDPDVIAWLDVGLAAGAREQFFGQSHRGGKFSPAGGGFNRKVGKRAGGMVFVTIVKPARGWVALFKWRRNRTDHEDVDIEVA